MSEGKKIKALREEKKITLAELSKMVRISVKTLEKYESGEMYIPKANLKKIAETLNTTSEELKKEEIAKPVEKKVVRKPKITDEEFMNLYKNLNYSSKDKVIDFLMNLNK